MNMYLRTFWGTCFVPINDSFLLAKGERIVKITTSFLPSCNACVTSQVAPISSISFGASIKNIGFISMPISGSNECAIVSTADVDNTVAFVLDFLSTACNDLINNCDVAYQLAFEIESDSLACPPPCLISNVHLDYTGIIVGSYYDLIWNCANCDSNVIITVHNVDTTEDFVLTACSPNGLPATLCLENVFNFLVLPEWGESGATLIFEVCCCNSVSCCGVSDPIELVEE
jgi:hypothetical protein